MAEPSTLTDQQIYDESERRYPVPEQTGPIPVDQSERDKAQELQTAFEAGAEWAREQMAGQEYTEWKATWRPEWVERRGEPVELDPGATGLSKEDAILNLQHQTQGGDFPGLRFWTRQVRKPEYGDWTEVRS